MSTLNPPLLQIGNGGRVSGCPMEGPGSERTRLSPASTKDDIVVPRRAASSRSRRITVSSMLSVVFICVQPPGGGLLDRTRFHDHHQAQRAIFEFLEGWYNPHRRHQGLGYQSPIDFEKSYQDAA